MSKIFTIASVPNGLEQKWLQHLRDFDTANAGCHFQVVADAPDIDMAEVVKLLQIDPPLPIQQIFARAKK